MDRLNIAGALIPEHSRTLERRLDRRERYDLCQARRGGGVEAATGNKFVVPGTIGPRSATNILW